MKPCASNEDELAPETRDFYRQSLEIARGSGVPFLVGGAYAFGCYTGITRDTKDLDLFVRGRDAQRMLDTFAAAGYEAEMTDAGWLGKACIGDAFVDLIFGSSNGLAPVDDEWFTNAVGGKLLDLGIKLCPAEEMIWQKAFIQVRHRFDGADVAHLIRARAEQLDWQRLLRRFGPRWHVLLSHLILFGFIYPSERDRVPASLMHELIDRLQAEVASPPAEDKICRGTLLSAFDYEYDVDRWDYIDARPLVRRPEE